MTSPKSTPPRPFDAIMLDVGDGHWLYVEQVGTLGGVPALFLHGGPGSGAQHSHRSLFDPTLFHTFLYDQRGAGRSHPYLALQANDTERQIADIERIRAFYNIDRWLVVGGSWGSTLALAYAQAHPDRVEALVLRAVFLGTGAEVQWAFDDGPRRFYPDLHASFLSALAKGERDRPIKAYIKRLLDPDPDVQKPAAALWHNYERALSELRSGVTSLRSSQEERDGPVRPTPVMEAHYIQNSFFLEPDQLLNGMSRLEKIPGMIVQGRYDLLCPPQAAYAIASRWPGAQLKLIDDAGHAMTEPGVFDAMHQAISQFGEKIKTRQTT